MIVFGQIPPFLDGNGPVQRLTLQCLGERIGYGLEDWTVHPKPSGTAVDRLLAAGDVRALADALAPVLRA